jgi:hypothetical protein
MRIYDASGMPEINEHLTYLLNPILKSSYQ